MTSFGLLFGPVDCVELPGAWRTAEGPKEPFLLRTRSLESSWRAEQEPTVKALLSRREASFGFPVLLSPFVMFIITSALSNPEFQEVAKTPNQTGETRKGHRLQESLAENAL